MLGRRCAVILGLLACAAAAGEARAQAQAPLRIISFGAHPDDCELKSAGVGAKWAALGHKFKCVAVTNGDIGHAGIAGGQLALRRRAEAKAAAKILGTENEVLDIHDGELMVTLENRRTISRLIREWQADVVISHRPNDYHPDHRYTGVLVMDAAYMVQVPFFGPDVPPLRRNPVFLFSEDASRSRTRSAATSWSRSTTSSRRSSRSSRRWSRSSTRAAAATCPRLASRGTAPRAKPGRRRCATSSAGVSSHRRAVPVTLGRALR
jgi:LmbE family N-acetylglucosaminyl deacetylase